MDLSLKLTGILMQLMLPTAGGANLKSVIAQYDVVSGILESIKDGQDLIKDYAEKVINQQTADLPAAMQTLKGATYNLPALQNLFHVSC
jgi:hypothetical protein